MDHVNCLLTLLFIDIESNRCQAIGRSRYGSGSPYPHSRSGYNADIVRVEVVILKDQYFLLCYLRFGDIHFLPHYLQS